VTEVNRTDAGTGVEDRVRGVLRDVFGIDPASIGVETSKDTVEGWDSLQHLTVVLSLEEEFGIQFDDEESMSLVTYPLIVLTVSDRLTRSQP
jgi:acyl carrier protein